MSEDIIFDEAFKPEPIPDVIYHYTSIGTLMDILETGEMWSTSIDYLNDVSEQQYVIDRVRERIPTFIERGDLPAADIFSKLMSTDLKSEKFEAHPFVLSFCGQADSLDHWRSYCPDGNGVSIGFKADCLKRATVKLKAPKIEDGFERRTHLIKVKYIDESNVEVIDKIIEFAMVAAKYLSSTTDSIEPDRNSMSTLFDFFVDRLACSCKHPSFRNEDEYRLIVAQPLMNYQPLKFRIRKSTLRPHIPVSIPRKVSGHENDAQLGTLASALAGRRDFIDTVVIGPTVSQELSLQSVQALMNREQLNVAVRSSKVPYRDW